jgi:hypothetical protein
MRIELKNKTHYRDDHIRAFLVKGIQTERPDLCKHGARPMRVIVSYRRNTSGSSGCAYLHSHWMTVRLPKDTTKIDKVDFALVIAHELGHTRGLDHRRMNSCATYGRVGRWREIYAWADGLPLEVKPKTSKRKQPDAKLEHCKRMFKAALTREKRATTLRKKWEAKVKYYTKRAATPPSKGDTHVASAI